MDANALLDLLGNENRRRILRLLSRKPCYVTEISEHLSVSPKAVIDHLRKLEEAGLIESRVDEKRRKYFHIAENIRLEVTLAPHDFGMKSAYPASPSLDLSRCQYLSVEMTHGSVREGTGEADAEPAETGDVETTDAGDVEAADGGVGDVGTADAGDVGADGTDAGDVGAAGDAAGVTTSGTADDAPPVSDLIEELDELENLERELSLAQRWVQGRIAAVLERLGEAIDSDASLDTEILSALADGAGTPGEIGNEVGVPAGIVEDHLRRLERRGVIEHGGGEWALADS